MFSMWWEVYGRTDIGDICQALRRGDGGGVGYSRVKWTVLRYSTGKYREVKFSKGDITKKNILSNRSFEFNKFQQRTKKITKEEFDVTEDPRNKTLMKSMLM